MKKTMPILLAITLLLTTYMAIGAEKVEETKAINSNQYAVKIESIYDADTLTVDIYLGFGVVLDDQKLRLYGINAWEVTGEEKIKGKIARDWLREYVKTAPMTISAHKDFKKGKYGRWVVTPYVGGVNICDQLVKLGHAVKKDY